MRYRVYRNLAGELVHDAVNGLGITNGCPGYRYLGNCRHVHSFREEERAAAASVCPDGLETAYGPCACKQVVS